MLKIIGLTGTIGSGKSTVSQILTAKGYPLFDADKNVHDLMNDNQMVIDTILQTFGTDTLMNNKIDRQKLGSIVLGSSHKLRELESILYPHIINNIKEFTQDQNGLCFLDIPLLFEKNFDKFCNDVLVISVDSHIQEQRVLDRPQMTQEKLKQFLNEQMPIQEKEKLASYVIHNNSSLENLSKNLDKFLLKIK